MGALLVVAFIVLDGSAFLSLRRRFSTVERSRVGRLPALSRGAGRGHDNQHLLLSAGTSGALRLAHRRRGDHERVPARDHPLHVPRHAAPQPCDRGQGRREPSHGDRLRARRDQHLVRRRVRDSHGSRIDCALDTGHVVLLVVGTVFMTALSAAMGVGIGAVVRNQVFAVIRVIVWALLVTTSSVHSSRT